MAGGDGGVGTRSDSDIKTKRSDVPIDGLGRVTGRRRCDYIVLPSLRFPSAAADGRYTPVVTFYDTHGFRCLISDRPPPPPPPRWPRKIQSRSTLDPSPARERGLLYVRVAAYGFRKAKCTYTAAPYRYYMCRREAANALACKHHVRTRVEEDGDGFNFSFFFLDALLS